MTHEGCDGLSILHSARALVDVLPIKRLQLAAILSDFSDYYLSGSSKRENRPFLDDQKASFGIDLAIFL